MWGPYPVLVWPVVAAALTCAAQEATRSVLLEVPPEVSRQAVARSAGDASAPAAVLMLEDLELGSDEGLTIEVLGPPDEGSEEPGPVLAVAGTVGSPQEKPAAPLHHMTLAVPLNDLASRLLAEAREIRLTLRVAGSPGRPPLKFRRAYFQTPEAQKTKGEVQ